MISFTLNVTAYHDTLRKPCFVTYFDK